MAGLTHSSSVTTSVVIVGGGIAGLYCARELARQGSYAVTLLETREEFGGRIETLDLGPFKAECGPMRFELPMQSLFHTLCKDLNITFESFSGTTDTAEPATSYSLAENERTPRPDHKPLASLNLLRLGVYRMFGKETETVQVEDRKTGKKSWLVQLTEKDRAWLDALDDDSGGFDRERRRATIRGRRGDTKLWQMGFWNALSDPEVLSHQAVMKIRDQGTFYHLIPDNPNAAEWGIFWLRIFKHPELSTIPDGVASLTKRTLNELQTKWPEVSLQERQEVTAVRHGHGPHSIALDVLDKRNGIPRPYSLEADHVILALPQKPLLKLSDNFPSDVVGHLDSVIGFPLLKAFLVMDKPKWWPQGTPAAQTDAWQVPTRELHYWVDENDKAAMVLLYTDHPATEYWKQLVSNKETHERAEKDGRNPKLKRALIRYLAEQQRNREAVAEVTSTEKPVVKAWMERLARAISGRPDEIDSDLWNSVQHFAIRDWSRDPFGAGCHAWRPEVESWKVRERLKGFGLIGRDERTARTRASLAANPLNVHICGEAYSDYQGFIEGALRSATDVLKTIIQDYERPQSSAKV